MRRMEREDPARSDGIDSPDGVGLTLVRWMLSLTPEERLRVLQEHPTALTQIQAVGRARDRAQLRAYRRTLEERRKQGG